MPDKTTIKGKIEKTVEMLKVGEVIQLERFGFCRIDKGVYKIWFTHWLFESFKFFLYVKLGMFGI